MVSKSFYFLCALESYTVTLSGDKNSAPEFTKQSQEEKDVGHAKSRQLYSWELSKEPLDVSISMKMSSNIAD